MNNINQAKKYLSYADKISAMSKDPSTKVGAVFRNEVDPEKYIFGYNGMPRGLDDNHAERNVRPEKYFWYEHAERNAIYNVAREFLEGSMIFCTKFPDMESARAITSSGISKLITPNFSRENMTEEQLKMIERVYALLSESKVKIIEQDINNPKSSLEKKYINYINLAKDYGDLFSINPTDAEGVMILNKNFSHIVSGAKHPPQQLNNVLEQKSDEKIQSWTLSAVKNSVFNAARCKFKGTTATVTWCPCIDCSLSVIAVEVAKLETRKPDFTQESDMRWKSSFEQSMELFEAVNMDILLLDVPKVEIKIDPTPIKKNKMR